MRSTLRRDARVQRLGEHARVVGEGERLRRTARCATRVVQVPPRVPRIPPCKAARTRARARPRAQPPGGRMVRVERRAGGGAPLCAGCRGHRAPGPAGRHAGAPDVLGGPNRGGHRLARLVRRGAATRAAPGGKRPRGVGAPPAGQAGGGQEMAPRGRDRRGRWRSARRKPVDRALDLDTSCSDVPGRGRTDAGRCRAGAARARRIERLAARRRFCCTGSRSCFSRRTIAPTRAWPTPPRRPRAPVRRTSWSSRWPSGRCSPWRVGTKPRARRWRHGRAPCWTTARSASTR